MNDPTVVLHAMHATVYERPPTFPSFLVFSPVTYFYLLLLFVISALG